MNALTIRHDAFEIPDIISDDWFCVYDFEQLDIEIDGLQFGDFSGSADLALNDPQDGSFYVKHITINGTRGYRLSPGGVRWPESGVLALPLPARDDRTFKAHLFRALETALYESKGASEFFQREMECA